MKIFIGNTGSDMTAEDLYTLFGRFGKVTAAHVPKDENGNARGFGYVIMPDDMEAERAIRTLNKKRYMLQFLSVSEAIYSDRYNCTVSVH